LRKNHEIKAKEVRVVTEDGKQLGIMPLKKALQIAFDEGLDLVEVAPKANPPVCKIMDYGKFVYKQKKKLQEAKKKQTSFQVKEIKIRPKIDEHDLNTKLNNMKKFLSKGEKCKVIIVFRGREILHHDLGLELLNRIKEELKDLGRVEQEPKLEGRNMSMVLAPISATKS